MTAATPRYPVPFVADLDSHEHAIEAECVPIAVRPCQNCVDGQVQISCGHDPERGEILGIDTCPDCDGTGEIVVAAIEQEDLP